MSAPDAVTTNALRSPSLLAFLARRWRRIFWITAALRLAAVCVQFVIDDDEAWWVVAARALKNPFDYYLRAVDHKPPGIVWFYWLLGAPDPRIARLAFAALMVLGAYLLGRISRPFISRPLQDCEDSSVPWICATFFLVASVMASPKLFSVTADGLLVFFVIAAFAVALPPRPEAGGRSSRLRGRALAAGALLGCALLVKQTAVFFALPILLSNLPRRWSLTEIAQFALGSAAVYVPCVVLCHPDAFVYWNLTYPREVLTRARGTAFDSNREMLWSIFEFSLALFPLMLLSLRAKLKASKEQGLWRDFRDFRIQWLMAGLAGTFLGRGLFLHYFQLVIPPLCLLAAAGWSELGVRGWAKRLGFAWLGLGYLSAALIVALPFSGLFWGNDLIYYQAVAEKIKILAAGDKTVLVWGGTAMPLTFSGARYSSRFLIPRFAEPPYDTERTRNWFHEELGNDFPRVVVDLHERGDNKFNNPLSSDPFIFERLRNYHAFVSPGLPWVKFYLVDPPPAAAHLAPLPASAYTPYPPEREEWNQLIAVRDSFSHVLALERELRAHDSMALLAQQGADEQVRLQAAEFRDHPRLLAESLSEPSSKPLGLIADPRAFFETASAGDGEELPLPWRSPLWWAESAIVELQPKFYTH